MWIFTGPATEGSTAELNSSLLEANPISRLSLNDSHSLHKRQATEPTVPVQSVVGSKHARSTSESSSPASTPSNILRKAAPRAQVPISVRGSDILDDVEAAPLRAYLPSIVSSNVENMTGVGSGRSPPIFYQTSPLDVAGAHVGQNLSPTRPPLPIMPQGSPIVSRQITPNYQPASPKPKSMRGKIPTPPGPSTPSPPGSPANSQPGTPVAELNPGSPLLGASAFRDSAFSSATEFSREIPIKWTGPLADDVFQGKLEQGYPKTNRVLSTPVIPGGWQATPVSEKGDEGEWKTPVQGTPIHENEQRFESPEIVRPDFDLRRSEAALVGVIKSTSPTPPIPSPSKAPAGGGTGWVLVNVDAPKAAMVPFKQSKPAPTSQPSDSTTMSESSNAAAATTVPHHPSPEAKAIAIVDALETRSKKNSMKKDDSGVKRFFSINRKNSVSESPDR